VPKFGEKLNVRSPDQITAKAFASSWMNLPRESVYTREQFEDWFEPLTQDDVRGREVLELGCGNGSLMLHLLHWDVLKLVGIELGDSTVAARESLKNSGFRNWTIERRDLVSYRSPGYDVVYSIGVLHHLHSPEDGFKAVVRNVKPGGRFHCWVYAREGNTAVIWLVEPLRHLTSKLPWWITKYLIATPLALFFFLYVKLLVGRLPENYLRWVPLYNYCKWILPREFAFYRHVVFDQLIAPRTSYIRRKTIENWFDIIDGIDPRSTYIVVRNGNSWKFGGSVL
jgi:SAM-dependent methyltransferase